MGNLSRGLYLLWGQSPGTFRKGPDSENRLELLQGQRDRRNRIDERNKIKSSETDVGVGGNLTYDKGDTLNQWGKTSCFINGVGGIG